MKIETRAVALATGVELEYVVRGPEGGPPVLLLHGLSDSFHSFDTVAPLMTRHRTYAVTQRGHGRSSAGDAYALEAFAEDAAAFIARMGHERAYVVGHSMGACVALLLASRYPECVAGMALLGAFGDLAGHAAVAELAEAANALTDPADPLFMRQFQLSTLANAIDPAFLDLAVSESCRLKAATFQAIVNSMQTLDLPAAAAAVQCKSLVIWADQDAFCSRTENEQLAKILAAPLLTYHGVGHAVHWERPVEVARDLTDFFEALARAPRAA